MSEFALGLLIGVITGAIAGCILYYYIGTPKCEHQWEKIIDDIDSTTHNGDYISSKYIQSHIVVHMCKKCGKRKITRV